MKIQDGIQVAILGYGNQGRAQALNLRDSGVKVVIGSRPGESFSKAKADGFEPVSSAEAISSASVVMFLLPDVVIPKVFNQIGTEKLQGKVLGFAHGFAVHYRWIDTGSLKYFLVGPKGAGAILRQKYLEGEGLPGVIATSEPELKELATSYARAIGIQKNPLETTFQEEVECDLFGEQTVLCGGIPQLMEAAFETLVEAGFSPKMAFYECCFEAKMILDLWMKAGPADFTRAISPTAFYGGLTRGRRLIDPELKTKLKEMLREIRSGEFANEYRNALAQGMKDTERERARLQKASIENNYRELVSPPNDSK